jgi:hypothetical protein
MNAEAHADVPEGAAADGAAPAASTSDPREIAERFYDAFLGRRLADMEQLYAPHVHFKDTVFEFSDRAGTMRMWRALIGNPKAGGRFSYSFERVEGDVAIGRWVADYRLLGRPVHNEIESRLTIKDGLIVDHKDTFSWSVWARQAFPLGPLVDLPGVQLLVTRLLRRVVLR